MIDSAKLDSGNPRLDNDSVVSANVFGPHRRSVGPHVDVTPFGRSAVPTRSRRGTRLKVAVVEHNRIGADPCRGKLVAFQ